MVRVPLNHDPIHWLYKVKDQQSGKERTTTLILPKLQLLFFKNSKKQTEARIVQLIPEREYFRTTRDFSMSTFTGQVVYRDLEGKMTNLYEMQQGKVIKTVSTAEPVKKNGRTMCETIKYCHYTTVCTDRDGRVVVMGHMEQTGQYDICFPPQSFYPPDSYNCTNGWTLTETTTGYGNCDDGDNGGPGDGTGGGGGSAPSLYDQYAQDPQYAAFLASIPPAVVAWFLQYPWRVPAAHANKMSAEALADYFYCGRGQIDNSNANAFKHALWSGLNTYSWDANSARELGEAYEQSPGTANQHEMDLYNNQLGIMQAEFTTFYDSVMPFAELIANEIRIGSGYRLTDIYNGSSAIIKTDGLCQ